MATLSALTPRELEIIQFVVAGWTHKTITGQIHICEKTVEFPLFNVYTNDEPISAREANELRQSAFQRREQVDYGPPIGMVYIHSPEDPILYKLMYFGLSQQSKHSRDIAAILKSKKDEFDKDYSEQ